MQSSFFSVPSRGNSKAVTKKRWAAIPVSVKLDYWGHFLFKTTVFKMENAKDTDKGGCNRYIFIFYIKIVVIDEHFASFTAFSFLSLQ